LPRSTLRVQNDSVTHGIADCAFAPAPLGMASIDFPLSQRFRQPSSTNRRTH
jgi:hypothetical protein